VGEGGEAVWLNIASVVAEELHPVGNPALDDQGNVFVTFSGTRGEKVPFGVFMISREGAKEAFLGDITNPTGLVIGPDGHLYVSSRHTGTVYRSSLDRQVEKFADGLGTATGLAFDSKGNLFVGDRGGTLFRVSARGKVEPFCELEPSVSAYHLAIDRDDYIYLTGPTLATQDCVYRISPEAEVEVMFKGFGRPQGLAFDPSGRLCVTGSLKGRKGVYRFVDGSPELLISSPMLVGLAFGEGVEAPLYLADNERLYRIDLGA
jgi:sugar lactone lactonase YvrE